MAAVVSAGSVHAYVALHWVSIANKHGFTMVVMALLVVLSCRVQ